MNGLEALKKLFFDNEDLRVDITLNDRKVCAIYNAIRNDLERLEKIEKEAKELVAKGCMRFIFPSGGTFIGFDITNREDEKERLEKELRDFVMRAGNIKEIIGE